MAEIGHLAAMLRVWEAFAWFREMQYLGEHNLKTGTPNPFQRCSQFRRFLEGEMPQNALPDFIPPGGPPKGDPWWNKPMASTPHILSAFLAQPYVFVLTPGRQRQLEQFDLSEIRWEDTIVPAPPRPVLAIQLDPPIVEGDHELDFLIVTSEVVDREELRIKNGLAFFLFDKMLPTHNMVSEEEQLAVESLIDAGLWLAADVILRTIADRATKTYAGPIWRPTRLEGKIRFVSWDRLPPGERRNITKEAVDNLNRAMQIAAALAWDLKNLRILQGGDRMNGGSSSRDATASANPPEDSGRMPGLFDVKDRRRLGMRPRSKTEPSEGGSKQPGRPRPYCCVPPYWQNRGGKPVRISGYEVNPHLRGQGRPRGISVRVVD